MEAAAFILIATTLPACVSLMLFAHWLENKPAKRRNRRRR